MILRVVRAHDRLRRAHRREHAVVALAPVEDVRVGDRVGLDPADLGRDVVDEARIRAHARDDLRDGRGGERVARRGDERRVAVERGHDVVGRDLLLDRLAVRRLHPVRQRRDEGDERDPDHQRGGGRRGPARVPARVLAARARRRRGPAPRSGTRRATPARQLVTALPQPHHEDDREQEWVEERRRRRRRRPGRPTEPGPEEAVPLQPVRQQEERPGEDREHEGRPAPDRARDDGERPHDVRREHRDAEEEQQHAGRDREQPVGRSELVDEHRAPEDDEREDDDDARRSTARTARTSTSEASRPRAPRRSAARASRGSRGRALRRA